MFGQFALAALPLGAVDEPLELELEVDVVGVFVVVVVAA
jgi:hypothetical protein